METTRYEYKGEFRPARVTMGALRAFKRETGQDFLMIQRSGEIDSVDLAVLLWCALVSQGRAEGKPFEESLDGFLDNVTPDEVAAWFNGATGAEIEPEASKKKGTP